MKTKLELTKDQVNFLVSAEEQLLKAKFESDLKKCEHFLKYEKLFLLFFISTMPLQTHQL